MNRPETRYSVEIPSINKRRRRNKVIFIMKFILKTYNTDRFTFYYRFTTLEPVGEVYVAKVHGKCFIAGSITNR